MVIRQFFIAVLGVFGCYAQENALSNPYFRVYDDKVIASLYYLDVSNNFQINTMNSDGTKSTLDLIPNRKEQIGVNVSFKIVDFSVGFSPKFFADNKDNGNSKLFNFSTRFIRKKWMQTLVFINQKGFYVSESTITIPFPKLRSTKIGGVTSYIFNSDFSFKAIANQKEWQAKSSGSFIPNFSFFYTNLDLNDGGPDSESNVFEMTLSPSYYYNFVISNRVLLSAGLGIGGGISNIDSKLYGIYEAGLNFKLGYNKDSFFSFFSLNSVTFLQDNDARVQLNDTIANLNITLGYRFDPPKKVKEVYEAIQQKTGL